MARDETRDFDMMDIVFDMNDLDLLFRLLWETRPPRDREVFVPSEHRFKVRIPDVVLLGKGFPRRWYFTDKEGYIRRKSKMNLSIENIFLAFSEGVLPGDHVICALYYYSVPGEPLIHLDYLNVGGLKRLLDTIVEKGPQREGLLVKFVVPRGSRAVCIRSQYGNQGNVMEARANQHNVFERMVTMPQRAVTFETMKLVSETYYLRVSESVKKEVERTTQRVIRHIQAVLPHWFVRNIVLNFTIDNRDRLWITGSGDIDLGHRRERFVQEMKCKVPSVVGKDVATGVFGRGAEYRCPICRKRRGVSLTATVTFRNIILHSKKLKSIGQLGERRSQAAGHWENLRKTWMKKRASTMFFGAVKRVVVPRVIADRHPLMPTSEYLRLLSENNQEFLNEKIDDVCEQCFLEITDSTAESGTSDPLFLPRSPRTRMRQSLFVQPSLNDVGPLTRDSMPCHRDRATRPASEMRVRRDASMRINNPPRPSSSTRRTRSITGWSTPSPRKRQPIIVRSEGNKSVAITPPSANGKQRRQMVRDNVIRKLVSMEKKE